MKYRDLKPYDWVKSNGRFVQIESNDTHICCIRDRGNIIVRRYNEIAPIRLTKEILEQNKGTWQAGIHLYPNGKDWVVGIGNAYQSLEVMTIHFVHELQHIIWALGMDDNFKMGEGHESKG